ncbi:MAG: preprotein translocase subunit SecG [Blastocatellales bacterium]
MQSGKGGDVAAAFGGAGSQSAFGPRGPQKPLEKATAVLAAMFMLLALLFSLPGFGVSTVVSGGAAPASTPAPAAVPSASPVASASPVTTASPASSPETKPSASPAKK